MERQEKNRQKNSLMSLELTTTPPTLLGRPARNSLIFHTCASTKKKKGNKNIKNGENRKGKNLSNKFVAFFVHIVYDDNSPWLLSTCGHKVVGK